MNEYMLTWHSLHIYMYDCILLHEIISWIWKQGMYESSSVTKNQLIVRGAHELVLETAGALPVLSPFPPSFSLLYISGSKSFTVWCVSFTFSLRNLDTHVCVYSITITRIYKKLHSTSWNSAARCLTPLHTHTT